MAGFGTKDNDGSFGFKATSDGKVILGNTSDDVIQVTGSLDINGNIYAAEFIYHKGDDDTFVKFTDDVVILKAGGKSMLRGDPTNASGQILINNGGHDLDVLVRNAASGTLLYTDAGNSRVGIGTDSPDYTLDVAGNIGVDQYIYHNGDANTYINFTDDRVQFEVGNLKMLGMHKKASSPHQVTVNSNNNNIDFVVNSNNSSTSPILRADASTARLGIRTASPTVELDVAGTTKSNYYITTPSTQDLGSGTSSTLSIGSSLMFLDAESITGVLDMEVGMEIHTLTLPNGTTSGQRLTLVVEGKMGAADNVPIQIGGNLLGVVDFFMPTAKTSLNFVYYSTAAISAWYQV